MSRRAQKRGGKVSFVVGRLDGRGASRLSIPQEALENLPPERLFDALGGHSCGTRAAPAGRGMRVMVAAACLMHERFARC
jgi:hypothetical protein